jgi:tRNA modification GTPase
MKRVGARRGERRGADGDGVKKTTRYHSGKMKTGPDDTICAISSAAGVGGIGVLRMSGPAAHAILKAIFRPRKKKRSFASHRLCLGWIFDPDTNSDLDEVFAVFMKAPATYTRAPMAEVYSHGGSAVQKLILALMMRQGARLAQPGEFTKRAFLSGRIDLAQAESVLDIIESESETELACALAQVQGRLSARINAAKQQVLTLLAEVEAEIDFPDEALDLPPEAGRAARVGAVCAGIARLISSYDEGRAVRQGVTVLIVGRTNVGKSSLFNALVQRDRAIVTPIAGTTRDLVEDAVRIEGIKFTFTDTAGLRPPGDAIEREGIARVRKKIPEADIILWVIDASETYTSEDEEIRHALGDKKVIVVLNKADLPPTIDASDGDGQGRGLAAAASRVNVSALTGSGIDDLKQMLLQTHASLPGDREGAALLITNVRHKDALVRAEAALARACRCVGKDEPIAFFAFELKDALRCLGEITGETCGVDVLDEIFSRFCIGK